MSEWDRLEAEEAAAAQDLTADDRPTPPLEAYADNIVPIRDDIEPTAATDEDEALPGRASLADWSARSAPERRFIIPGWVVRGSAGLLSGLEGVGKSLIAQQMATCAAAGISFLGLEIANVPAVYISCEDEKDELWRRQESINAMLGLSMEDLQGKLEMVSFKGELGNELATFDSSGRLAVSKRYRQITKVCDEMGAGLVFLDNAAHFFTGNENARNDVAAFLGLVERLSIRIDGAVILLAHPNKQFSQGNTAGNEYSGSTGWSAHVRNRLFLNYREEGDDGLPPDDDERVLRKSKANYGKRGEEITFRWHEWAFTTLADLPSDTAREIAATAQASTENATFLACLDKTMEERRATSVSPAASNYAPRVFAKMTTARGLQIKHFEAALNRLLHLGEISGDQKLFQRANRTWATGIGRPEKCTNPRTNHAQSDAQSLHKAATEHSTNLHPAETPSTTYIGEPLGGSPKLYDQGDRDAWLENPILNPRKP